MRGRAGGQLFAELPERLADARGPSALARVDEFELERMPQTGCHELARARHRLAVHGGPHRVLTERRAQSPRIHGVQSPGAERLDRLIGGPLVARGEVDEGQQVAHRPRLAERAPLTARRGHVARGELGLEGGDLPAVVGDDGARAPGHLVVDVALAQQPRDRVVLLAG